MRQFSDALQFWYASNKRDLPWRHTQEAYLIWLSEVILQQTRVQQGLSYFHKFAQNFPTIQDMAAAKEQEILNLWQGLGYYSRARNMHKAAKFIIDNHKGKFPKSFDELLTLPGVGNYTAAAIASFAFDLPHAVLDGNVFRVLSRYFNFGEYINTLTGQKHFQKLANELLDKKNSATHNQAMMELGAMICTPKNPKCDLCPLMDSCEGKAKNTWSDLPRKKGKIKVRERHLNYFVCLENDRFLLNKRGEKDIWANMYEFPLLEGEQVDTAHLGEIRHIKSIGHKLTHQNLKVHFYVLPSEKLKRFFPLAEWVDLDELKDHPLPRVIERFMEEEFQLNTKH